MNEQSDSTKIKVKPQKKMKRLAWAFGSILGIWLLGDIGYSIYVASKLAAWEATVERDSEGVMKNCSAYSTGKGDTALLLVHGINDTPYTWRKLAPKLAQHAHVRAMRLPGFGETIEIYATKNSEDWIRAIEEEAQALRAKHKNVFVVAHSLGGAVTIQTVLRASSKQKQLFDGMILLAPAIEVSNRRSPLLPTRAWHNVGSLLFFTQTTYNPFGNDAQDPNEKDAENRVKFTPRSIINETFRLIDANRNRESEIEVPVLMVLSDKDQVNDYEASQNWLEKIKSSQKEIFWNNRSGHAIQYDIGWEEVAEKIIEFTGT